jgi:hypothetical protein
MVTLFSCGQVVAIFRANWVVADDLACFWKKIAITCSVWDFLVSNLPVPAALYSFSNRSDFDFHHGPFTIGCIPTKG